MKSSIFSKGSNPGIGPLWISLLLACGVVAAEPADRFARQRAALVEDISADVRATRSYLDTEALDPAVLDAMGSVPRHRFVRQRDIEHAYENRPLPIGHGQTISQPYIVAIMTDLLEPEPGDSVLEVGTGSGYQAAVLAEIVGAVRTIEIIEPLGASARERLETLGYHNVEVRIGDGYYGWPEHAPYDGIVVTAVASHVPPPLLGQLKPGGRMIIPVGSRFLTQQLVLVEKDAEGAVTTRQILPVR
ncbi:MAG TPA: protein-L-isoaspartate(D-aspartate) O-methyltransferase, partial [Gammaproteobacteria bacterium]|nr:protein-L-isoaspartate(D-aspartate) O-methyltransferase [Gammaproteobacteria bacterium]